MVIYIKDFFFSVNTSFSPICTQDGPVTYDPSKMVEIFTTVFQRKQYYQVINLLPHVFLTLANLFSFKSSGIKYYLKEMDYNGGSDPDNVFPLFLKKTDY